MFLIFYISTFRGLFNANAVILGLIYLTENAPSWI